MGNARQAVPVMVLAIGIGVGISVGGGASPRAAHPGERRALIRKAAAARSGLAPDIVLSGATRETRAVEARAAAFVRAVRRRDGARAVRFLARATPPPVRAAVARRDWPWRLAPQDLGPLFSQPALRLRALDVRGTHARIRIGPPHLSRYSLEGTGFYDLRMVREGDRWQVRLPAFPARQAGTGRER